MLRRILSLTVGKQWVLRGRRVVYVQILCSLRVDIAQFLRGVSVVACFRVVARGFTWFPVHCLLQLYRFTYHLHLRRNRVYPSHLQVAYMIQPGRLSSNGYQTDQLQSRSYLEAVFESLQTRIIRIRHNKATLGLANNAQVTSFIHSHCIRTVISTVAEEDLKDFASGT